MRRRNFDEVTEVQRLETSFDDFEGNLAEWKDHFYMIWRYQMTWKFAYKIEVFSRKGTAILRIVCKPWKQGEIREQLEVMGYRNINSETIKVGLLYRDDDVEEDDPAEVFFC